MIGYVDVQEQVDKDFHRAVLKACLRRWKARLRKRLADPDLPGGGSFPEVAKVALNFEDIDRYNLPPDFTKSTDSRAAAFIREYGDVAVELDALPTDVLRDRIQSEVTSRMDLEALEKSREQERREQEKLDVLLDISGSGDADT